MNKIEINSKNLIMSENEINKLSNIDIKDCDIDTLVDIESVKVDTQKTKIERVIDYFEKINNPYLFKVGNSVVKIKFNDEAESIEDKVYHIIDNLLEENVG